MGTLILLMSALLMPPAVSQPPQLRSVSLAWDRSTTTNVVGYNVYQGTNQSAFMQVGVTTGTNWTSATNLVATNTYYFAVSSVDSFGVESDLSASVQWPVTLTNYIAAYVDRAPSPLGPWTAGTQAVYRITNPVAPAGFIRVREVRDTKPIP